MRQFCSEVHLKRNIPLLRGYVLTRDWPGGGLTLVRVSFFAEREHTCEGGGLPPLRAISLLSVIELRDKNQRIGWDVPNPMVCELTYLGQPLTFQARSNEKCSDFRDVNFVLSFSSMTYSLFEIERWICHHRLSLVMADRQIYFETRKGHLVTLTSGHRRSRSWIDLNRSNIGYQKMRLDKTNTLAPTPCLYHIPIKSYRGKVYWPYDVIIWPH